MPPEAVAQNPFYQQLLEECIRCDSAMEAARDDLSKIKADLTQVPVISSGLEGVLSKFPQWMESLRVVVVQDMLASFKAAVEQYVSSAENTIGDFQEMEESGQAAFCQELRSLTRKFQSVASLESKGLQDLACLRAKVAKVLSAAEHQQKCVALNAAVEFVEGGDIMMFVGDETVEASFIETLSREDLENLDVPAALSGRMHDAAVALTLRLLSWTGEKDTSSDEVKHLSDLWSALSRLQRILKKDDEDAKLRASLLKLLGATMPLRKATHEMGDAEALAQKPSSDIISAVTNLKALILRCKDDIEGARQEVENDDEEKAVLVEAQLRAESGQELASQYLSTAKQCVENKIDEEMQAALAASAKLFGTLEARTKNKAGLWAHKLATNTSWDALVRAANETLLKEDYVDKISKFLRATKKDWNGTENRCPRTKFDGGVRVCLDCSYR